MSKKWEMRVNNTNRQTVKSGENRGHDLGHGICKQGDEYSHKTENALFTSLSVGQSQWEAWSCPTTKLPRPRLNYATGHGNGSKCPLPWPMPVDDTRDRQAGLASLPTKNNGLDNRGTNHDVGVAVVLATMNRVSH